MAHAHDPHELFPRQEVAAAVAEAQVRQDRRDVVVTWVLAAGLGLLALGLRNETLCAKFKPNNFGSDPPFLGDKIFRLFFGASVLDMASISLYMLLMRPATLCRAILAALECFAAWQHLCVSRMIASA